MAQALTVEQSREIPVAQADAFRGTLAVSLPELVHRRFLAIAPVTRVDGQVGEWQTVGQTRKVTQSDGTRAVETLIRADEPRSIGYTLTEIEGPFGVLVRKVGGEFTFAPAGTGTVVTWRWTIYPRSFFLMPGVLVIGLVWQGWARQVLEELSYLLVE